jgi:hypothetical protein
LLAYPKETVVAEKLEALKTRHRQYPHEGFLRPADSVSHVRVRTKNSHQGDSKHISETRNRPSDSGPARRLHLRVL